MYIGFTNTHFKRIGTMVGDGRRWSSHTCLTVQMVLCTPSQRASYMQRVFSGAMKAGLTVQRVTCTCMGTGLAVRRVRCTSSQLAWTCKECLARSNFREIQSPSHLCLLLPIHILASSRRFFYIVGPTFPKPQVDLGSEDQSTHILGPKIGRAHV